MKSGKCSQNCGNDQPSLKQVFNSKHKSGFDICRQGEVFCMETGKCARECNQKEKYGDADMKTFPQTVKCHQGEIFCITTGKYSFLLLYVFQNKITA